MSDKLSDEISPQKLLLATDLDARCDRAQERAIQLAQQWQAQLLLLTVLEVPRDPDLALAWILDKEPASIPPALLQHVHQDIAGLGNRARIRVANGDPARTIEQVAREEESTLIISGMARNEAFGRFLLGSTIERLARIAESPLLVVRNRVYGPYRRILVATDFSDISRRALKLASQLFSSAELILYHARGREASLWTSASMEGFLAESCLTEAVKNRLQWVCEDGPVETALAHYVRNHEVDLVVMGGCGQSCLTTFLLGSVAEELLNWLPCDTLLVR